MARRRRSRRRNSLRGRPRDSKGRLLKINKKRRRRANPVKRRRRRHVANPVRRRRHKARATPRRRRRRNKARVVVVNRHRRHKTRRVANVARRRRRKHSARRRSRRRNVAVNPRRHRRRRYNRARGHRRTHRRRRNAGLGSLVGRVNFMQVLEVGVGVLAGDKVTTYLGNTVSGWLGLTDPMTSGLVKVGLGVVVAGLVWRFRPALGLGVAVGAVNGLVNQYIFTPIWGMASGYLPAGMAGFRGVGDYVNRDWRIDNWLAQGGGAAVAGLGNGNSLNRSSL